VAGAREEGQLAKYRFSPLQTREVPGQMTPGKDVFTVLDLALGGTVNGADCRPLRITSETGRDGAIAQLGERVVRNDEVGGSIPPGSTSLRSLRELRLGKPTRVLS
jgi:hypothetical protein